MTTQNDYQADARQFVASFRDGLRHEIGLVELLQNADGTLADWREAFPTEATEADRLAEEIGFDIPNTDDYCWQAAEALDEHLSETGGYGYSVHKVIRITLAGGGPAGWIDFTVDENATLLTAVVNYQDWFQTAITFTLSDTEAESAYNRYNVDALL
jgi:hypothetical protein